MRKPVMPYYPLAIEQRYQRQLDRVVNIMLKRTKKQIIELMKQQRQDADLRDVPDSPNGFFASLLLRLKAVAESLKPELNEVKESLPVTALEVTDFARSGTERNLNRELATGKIPVKARLRSDVPQDLIEKFVAENITLIDSIPEKYLGQVHQTIVNAWQQGAGRRAVSALLEPLIDPDKAPPVKRARVIARDQLGKLSGQVQRYRQKEAGVTHYIWRTMEDGRVRPEHALLDGKKISWDAPPAEANYNHPGGDFQCRCYAEAIFPELDDLEAELEPVYHPKDFDWSKYQTVPLRKKSEK